MARLLGVLPQWVIQRHVSSTLIIHSTLGDGPHLCCPGPNSQAGEETEKCSLLVLKDRKCHPTLFFSHSVHENLVAWPYLAAREAGKCNLAGKLCA